MRKRVLSLILILSLMMTAAASLSPAFSADEADEFTYTVYLNIAPAYSAGDKTVGGVNTIGAYVEYDAERLELISDLDRDFKTAFPILKMSRSVVNNDEEGILYFNSITLGPYIFDDDNDVLVSLRFRYKKSGGRAYVRTSITEITTETESGYDFLILKNNYVRDGIRVKAVRTPDNASGQILGDADGDTEITVSDAVRIQRYIAYIAGGDFIPAAADADGDSEITVKDASCIQRYTVHLKAPKGIGEPIG